MVEPDENEDEGLIEQAVSIVRSTQRASAPLLQRRLRIGYPRAARLLDQLEEMGVVGPSLDGTMARLRGESSDFGAFVDSVSDRYLELIIYSGLLYHFLVRGEPLGGMLTFGAAAGSVLVSYVKARAEGLGYEAEVGLLTRAERYLVLAPSLIFNQLNIGLGILAVFANITALQRIWHVRKHAHAKMKK